MFSFWKYVVFIVGIKNFFLIYETPTIDPTRIHFVVEWIYEYQPLIILQNGVLLIAVLYDVIKFQI